MIFWLLACGGPSPPASVTFYDQDADGVFAFVDCDDTNAGTYPGAPDVPYDGRDANCDGADDYDQDGDGYRWEAHGGDDCDDTDPTIHPGSPELPYDGHDNDCDPLTSDADLDGDGVRAPTDCDDADPATYPGAPERLGDGVDNDCGDDGDGAPLGAWPDALKAPYAVRAATFEGVPVVGFLAEQITVPDTTADPLPRFEVGVALLDPLGAQPELLLFHGEDHDDPEEADAPSALDLAATPDTLWFGLGVTTWRSGIVRAHLRPFVRIGASLSRQNGPIRTIDEASSDLLHLDVALQPNDQASLTATSVRSLTVIRGGVEISDGAGGTVEVDGTEGAAIAPDGEVWSCDAGRACSAWSLPDDAPPTDPEPLADVTRVFRERDGYLLVDSDDGVRLEGLDGVPLPLFPDEEVIDVDAVVLPRDGQADWVVAAAVVEAGNIDQLLLAFGPADAGLLSQVHLRGDDHGTPTSVAVWADAHEVLVAASTQSITTDPDRLWLGTFPWATPIGPPPLTGR